MSDGVVVGVAQVGARVADVPANLALAGRYARRAADRGADLVVLPECFLQGYSLRRSVLALAEPLGGPAVAALAGIAARWRVAIVAGLIEANPVDPVKPFNTAVVIGRDGSLVGSYRKTHCFDREVDAFTPGDAYPVFELELASRVVAGDGGGGGTGSAVSGRRPLRLGVCICADIEFPEVARLLAIGGAELIAVPSADMEPYRAQQAANLMSRAIENNLHVALANTVDRRPNVTFFGGSGVASPDGALVSAGYGRPRLVTATLRDAAVAASGGAGASLRARRVETYGRLLDGGGGRRA